MRLGTPMSPMPSSRSEASSCMKTESTRSCATSAAGGGFRRADRRRRTIQSLHRTIGEAARRPGLYTALGVPDTVEGRFEAILRHVRRWRRQLAEAAQHEDHVQAQRLEPALHGVGHAERRIEAGPGRTAGLWL
jgi:hypothetical protein